jgi:hypothetical protein
VGALRRLPREGSIVDRAPAVEERFPGVPVGR